jgi:hypothetical protein
MTVLLDRGGLLELLEYSNVWLLLAPLAREYNL